MNQFFQILTRHSLNQTIREVPTVRKYNEELCSPSTIWYSCRILKNIFCKGLPGILLFGLAFGACEFDLEYPGCDLTLNLTVLNRDGIDQVLVEITEGINTQTLDFSIDQIPVDNRLILGKVRAGIDRIVVTTLASGNCVQRGGVERSPENDSCTTEPIAIEMTAGCISESDGGSDGEGGAAEGEGGSKDGGTDFFEEAPCIPQSHHHQGCYPKSGPGTDVYWFDSCGNREEQQADCQGERAHCVQVSEEDARCQCFGHWQGSLCDQCPGHWDPLRNCAVCQDGWGGEDCTVGVPNLVWVEFTAGSFLMGDNSGGSTEIPRHNVTVPRFYMAKTEITVDQYLTCSGTSICQLATDTNQCNHIQPDHSNYPYNCATWSQAQTFCRWLGGDLPSESLWEYAARGGGQEQTYPWGEAAPDCDRAVMSITPNVGHFGCDLGLTWEVCSKPLGNTPQGLCDLSGNVLEWIADNYHDNYMGAPSDGGAWVTGGYPDHAVARGGCYIDQAPQLTTTYRFSVYKDTLAPRYSKEMGFRCVWVP